MYLFAFLSRSCHNLIRCLFFFPYLLLDFISCCCARLGVTSGCWLFPLSFWVFFWLCCFWFFVSLQYSSLALLFSGILFWTSRVTKITVLISVLFILAQTFYFHDSWLFVVLTQYKNFQRLQYASQQPVSQCSTASRHPTSAEICTCFLSHPEGRWFPLWPLWMDRVVPLYVRIRANSCRQSTVFQQHSRPLAPSLPT
jgi:hypothetical protein